MFDKYNKTIFLETMTDYLIKITRKNNKLLNYV